MKSRIRLSHFKRVRQKITLLNRKESALMTQKKLSQEGRRKQRTKTLIQLGGLLSKTKFLDLFDISLGEDLQHQGENSYKGMQLLGLLKDLSDQLPDTFTHEQLEALKEKGIMTILQK